MVSFGLGWHVPSRQGTIACSAQPLFTIHTSVDIFNTKALYEFTTGLAVLLQGATLIFACTSYSDEQYTQNRDPFLPSSESY